MDCKKLNEFYTEYLDGAISDDLRARFDSHLSQCRRCREDFALFQAVVSEAQQMRESELVAAPVALRANIRAAIQAPAGGGSWVSNVLDALRRPAYSLSLAGATVCAIILAVAISRGPTPMEIGSETPSTMDGLSSTPAVPERQSAMRHDGQSDPMTRQDSAGKSHEGFDSSKRRSSPDTDKTMPAPQEIRRLHEGQRYSDGHAKSRPEIRQSLEALGPPAVAQMQSARTPSDSGKPQSPGLGGVGGGFGVGGAGGMMSGNAVSPIQGKMGPAGPAGGTSTSEKKVDLYGGAAAPPSEGRDRANVFAQPPTQSMARRSRSKDKSEDSTIAKVRPNEKEPVALTEAEKREMGVRAYDEAYGRVTKATKNQSRPTNGSTAPLQDNLGEADSVMRKRDDNNVLAYFYLVPIRTENYRGGYDSNRGVNLKLGASVLRSDGLQAQAQSQAGEVQQNRYRAQRSINMPTLKAALQLPVQTGETTTLVAELQSGTKMGDLMLTVEAPRTVLFVSGRKEINGPVTIWSGSLIPQEMQRAFTRIRPTENGPQQITLTLLRNRGNVVAQQTFMLSVGGQTPAAASPAASKK